MAPSTFIPPNSDMSSELAYRYPENLNVFNAGTAPVVTAGMTRVVCLAVFGYGSFYAAPYILLYNDIAPWYTAALITLGSAIPIIATGLFWGGYVQHINILLPTVARRSKDDLMRFTSNMPPTALIQIKSMWFRPWPVTKEIFIEDLRRLPRSRLRLSNLEYIPQRNQKIADLSNPMSKWIAKKVMGTYFVNVSQFKDRSRAPGIWSKIWEQIPMVGEPHVERKDFVRRAVLPSNRAMPASRAGTGPTRQAAEKRLDQRAKTTGNASPKRSSRPANKP